MNITIAFVTCRREPEIGWFLDSLQNQCQTDQIAHLIIVDAAGAIEKVLPTKYSCFIKTTFTEPKPTVWQGRHRITKEDWWAMSNARNTALCLCDTSYIVWVDDRCVLGPRWLEGVREAANAEYAVCGTYEKHHNMRVENGNIIDPGRLDGKDARALNGIALCHHQFWGGTYGIPVEWALKVNGWEEMCDSLGAEDYIMGMMLCNAGCVNKFDPRLMLIQDRTPDKSLVPRKTSKERFSHDTEDKGHKAIERFGAGSKSQHPWDIRAIRDSVLAGNAFPSVETYPQTDWFDGQPIKDME
jgi:hypothetical protein